MSDNNESSFPWLGTGAALGTTGLAAYGTNTLYNEWKPLFPKLLYDYGRKAGAGLALTGLTGLSLYGGNKILDKYNEPSEEESTMTTIETPDEKKTLISVETPKEKSEIEIHSNNDDSKLKKLLNHKYLLPGVAGLAGTALAGGALYHYLKNKKKKQD